MLRRVSSCNHGTLVVLAIAVLYACACGPSGQTLRRQRAKAAFDRAEADEAAGRIDEAIAGYGEAIRLAPGYTRAYNGRGVLYQQKGQLDEAIADYTTAIGQLPHEPNFYFNRASAYQAQGETAKAKADLQKAKGLSGLAGQTEPTRGR
jgi:tetratricopeptide (TPR) repeat protein